MTRGNRILSTFVLLGLLTLSLSDAARSQSTPAKTVTISGATAVAGVTLRVLRGATVMTDEIGFYSVEVPQGWAGTITPVKLGHVFEPPVRTYKAVAESLENEDYVARVLTFTISGNAGAPEVVLQGLPQEVVSDSQGKYQAQVDYGWSGTVTPMKEGYRFEPHSRDYRQVVRNFEKENYTAKIIEFTISGNVGLSGVTIRGFPDKWMIGVKGEYRALVPYGWSGVVTPEKEGYRFEPPYVTFSSVTQDLTNMDFTPSALQVTISNVIKVGNEPIQDVQVTAQPGDYTVVTDSQGRYSLKVPYGWSGRLTFSKPGFDFGGGHVYRDLTTHFMDGKPVPAEGEWLPYPSGGSREGVSVPAGEVLVIPTADALPEKIAETTEDLRVMLQILREKLSEPRMIRGVLRDYGSLLGEDRRAEAIYLQGSAALFVIGADFPPSSPVQQPGEDEPPTQPQGEAADPVWQRARQKLYEPGARTPSPSGQTQTMTFEQFKEELLRSLKHAANIRHIDPNELVVLTLVAQNEGASRAGEADVMKQYANMYGSDYMAMMGTGRPARATTVLTMQARKSDIDAFAQGALDFNQFSRKVRSFTY